MKTIFFLFLILGFSCGFSWAGEVGVSTQNSSDSSSQTYSGGLSGNLNEEWTWDGYLDHTQSQWTTSDAITGAQVKGNAQSSTLGAVFNRDAWTLSPALVYSDDRTNKVTSSEIQFDLAWKYIFDSKSEESNEDESKEEKTSFSPWLKPMIKIGRRTYKAAGATRRNDSELIFGQAWTQTGVTVKPLGWLSLALRQKNFTYTKDPQEVVSKLETRPGGTDKAALGLTDTLSSLLLKSSTVATAVSFLEDWELGIYRTWSTNQSDESTSVDSNVSLHWDITENWNLGLQTGQTTSGSSTDISRYSGASVEYQF